MESLYDYFVPLWEDANEQSQHVSDRWNERAYDWEKLLSFDSTFRRSHMERVAVASKYLRERGALFKGCRAIDIGCGPGRFVAEFAKTAELAVGTDISENMIRIAQDYARETGQTNSEFVACDFKAAQPGDYGWEGAFDLVFASITSAVSGLDGLRKMIAMSRAFCVSSSFVQNSDTLRDSISKEVFNKVAWSGRQWQGQGFHALLNLLWLDGYYPETSYHVQSVDEVIAVDDDTLTYYTRMFSREPSEEDAVRREITDYLNSIDNGGIAMRTERIYGRVLWDVRERTARR